MQSSREAVKKHKLQSLGCKAFCCSSCSRLSVSSSDDGAESSQSGKYATISSLTHAMVQEKLDQMIIRERQRARSVEKRARSDDEGTKFILMVAMEKASFDPRKNFRDSIEEMIKAYQIHHAKDLRCLLNYYISMNSEQYRVIILEVFHEVCTKLFLSCKYYRYGD